MASKFQGIAVAVVEGEEDVTSVSELLAEVTVESGTAAGRAAVGLEER